MNNQLQFIGGKIRQARETANFSQSKLADLAGIRQATVSDIEQGRANFEIGTLFRIMDILGLMLDIIPMADRDL